MAVINGTTGANRLNGTSGNDIINPGRGSDYVFGNAGADVLIWSQDSLSRNGIDRYFGGDTGENYDSNMYGPLTGGDRLYLSGAGAFRVVFSSTEGGSAQDAFGNRLYFAGIERLQTGAGNDYISGAAAQLNAARGSGSSHTPVHGLTVNSGAGNDTIYGSAATDVLDPGTGNDRVYGGGGNDLLMPSPGDDYGHAGAGDDNVRWGNHGSMSDFTNIGRDTLVGGAGHDLLNLWATGNGDNSAGVNAVFTSNSAGRASFPQGNGSVVFSEFEQFWTHQGRDTVSGANASIGLNQRGLQINTRWGDDRVTGSAGKDTLEGGEGADTIDGGRGNDVISMNGDIFADSAAGVSSDAGRDLLILRDGFGADTIRGFQINDHSGAPSDRLFVGTLHDRAGNLVDVNDVTVVAGSGGALLRFPNGESILLEGVSASSLTRAMLTKLGIPGSTSASAAASPLAATAADTAEAKSATAPASTTAAAATMVADADADHFAWRPAPPTGAPEHAPRAFAALADLWGDHDVPVASQADDSAGAHHLLAQIFDWQ